MRGLIYGGIGFAAGIAAALFLEPRPMGRREIRVDAEIAELQAQLERNRAETRELEKELARLRASASAPPPASEPARETTPESRARWTVEVAPSAEIPAAVRDAAAALRVPDDALRAAFDASLVASAENLSRLERHGTDGFRALVALVRGGHEFQYLDQVFAASWKPSMAGEEQLLIELVESDDGARFATQTALCALGFTDTPRVREYLLERVRTERNDLRFMYATSALRTLWETRALPDLWRALRNKEWSEASRHYVCKIAVQMAGESARDPLIDYLREPGADLLGPALDALNVMDAEAAAQEAKALLAARAETLTGSQLAAARRYADGR